MAAMTFDEVIELLKRPPSMERTLFYTKNRGCWPYRPHGGRAPEALLPHVREHQRACFNCGENKPEYQGTCWGNMICEIWVCADCAPMVREGCERQTEQADDHASTIQT